MPLKEQDKYLRLGVGTIITSADLGAIEVADPEHISIPFAGTYLIRSERDRCNARKIVKYIQECPAAFDRAAPWGHVTASAFILNNAHDHVLLTHHAKLGCWLPLGGHCDGIRDPRFVALKEAYEESGLSYLRPLGDSVFDVDIHDIPAHGGMAEHKHLDLRFLLEADQSERLHPTAESKALAWVPIKQLSSYSTKSSVLILLKKLVTS